MRLKRLELYGFKSFVSRTEIVLDDGITGIVGPNGSGKSNIGDAVRWVLGEQSAKTLRGASMTDVIFNGTQRRKPASYCEVSLVFDNDDRALPMDFAEVMVTRRVYRSGDSEYFLNQAACRLKDIVDLFRDTGIGRDGYSIIGQGRIDDILSRRSEDRRQVFEEAAGITKFRTRKEEADRKLQRTLENADRVEDIAEELKRRLGPLEEQSRDARRYLELMDELKGLDLNLYLLRSERLSNKLKALDEEMEQLRVTLADAEAALNEKTVQRDACSERISQLDERISSAHAELLTATEAAHAVEREIQSLRARMENREENKAQLLSEQAKANEEIRQIEKLRSGSEADLIAIREELEQAEETLRAAEKAAEEATRLSEEADIELEEKKEALVSAMNLRSDRRNTETRLNTMRSQMLERSAELTDTETAMRSEEEELKEAVDKALQMLQLEQQQRDRLAQAHADVTADLARSDAELIRIRAEGEKLASALQEKQSRWRLMNEWTREMEGYSQSVRRAVQYARDRGMTGVKGVLAQLIRVPAKYETAIDMALGAALQNIITDTEETAKQLIDYLRSGKLGRATFLPLSAMRPKLLNEREKQVLKMPGAIGAACDLVECDAAYRPVVENLLGRTVIADDLGHGIAMMRAGNHAFRLVTLNGDVMHSGGSMTGGSVQSRGINLLGREREMDELTAQLRTGREELEALRGRLRTEQQRKDSLKQEVADALEELHQQEIAVARETERSDNAKEELRLHRERLEETQQAVAQLQEALSQIDAELEETVRQAENPLTDQTALENEIRQLQLLRTQRQADVKSAQDRTLQCTVDVSDRRHALDVMRRDSERYSQDRQRLEQAEAERQSQLERIAEETERSRQLLNELNSQAEAATARQSAQEKETRELEERRSATQRELTEVLSSMDSLNAGYNRDSERLHRLELQRSRVENDSKNLTERIWNTWQLTYAGAEEYRKTEGFNEKEAEHRCAELSSEIRELGDVNVHAVEEYADTKARYDELYSQLEDLHKAESDLRELIESLLKQMRVTFVSNFSLMQGYFSETFTRLFGGGKAELTLTDPDDPLNCGIEVNVQPPGKKLQLLSLLSGGEKALTAIAILFAMLKLKPTPFCILDEIEAALDDANIGYYADYLKEYSLQTQFVVITHRKGTMERCNSLYGVAMEEQGVSKMVSVELKDYEE